MYLREYIVLLEIDEVLSLLFCIQTQRLDDIPEREVECASGRSAVNC